jgi:hypothetical protein
MIAVTPITYARVWAKARRVIKREPGAGVRRSAAT